jgi:hypothetical protein
MRGRRPHQRSRVAGNDAPLIDDRAPTRWRITAEGGGDDDEPERGPPHSVASGARNDAPLIGERRRARA